MYSNAKIKLFIFNTGYKANSLIAYKLTYFTPAASVFSSDIMSSIEKSKPNVLFT